MPPQEDPPVREGLGRLIRRPWMGAVLFERRPYVWIKAAQPRMSDSLFFRINAARRRGDIDLCASGSHLAVCQPAYAAAVPDSAVSSTAPSAAVVAAPAAAAAPTAAPAAAPASILRCRRLSVVGLVVSNGLKPWYRPRFK